MKKIISAIIAFILISLAMPTAVLGIEDAPLLFDEADLLSENDEARISEELESASDKYDVDFIIATFPTTNGENADYFAKDYYDECGFGRGDMNSAVFLFIAMEDEVGERTYIITTNGFATDAISENELYEIEDSVASHLTDGSYALAADAFIDGCEYQINGEINGFPFDYGMSIIISLVIGIAVAFIVTGIWKSQLNSAVMQRGAANYTKEGSLNITAARDLFLYRTVTRTKKPESSGGSGGRGSGGSRSVRGKF